jgi:hypothetical protein
LPQKSEKRSTAIAKSFNSVIGWPQSGAKSFNVTGGSVTKSKITKLKNFFEAEKAVDRGNDPSAFPNTNRAQSNPGSGIHVFAGTSTSKAFTRPGAALE